MLKIRKTSIVSLALGLLTLTYLVRRYTSITGPKYLYGQDGPLYNAALFSPGVAKPQGENYTRVLVMGHLKSEDVSWVARELPGLATKIYTVDESSSYSELPANKGHEAMIYLTYIIDHYDRLPEVVLFFHPHQHAWHNNILLDLNAATTIKLLSDAHVARQGYFNTRCHLDPGCPNWLHVDRPRWRHDLKHKPEEPALSAQVFHDLHGADMPVPRAISQPCCAQFAVSGERIRQRPRDDYVRYRSWLLATALDDKTSGRLMEYSWQYLFTGNFEFCPSQHKCYCDGYGICFDGDKGLQEWLAVLRKKEAVDDKIEALFDSAKQAGDKYQSLARQSAHYGELLDQSREDALRRGFDPRSRAEQCAREWHEGDGF